MNYYERIQQSIDYIELHLTDELSVDEAAKQAYMSVSNYYRMFYSITGSTVKEYIRLRRLSCAANDLLHVPASEQISLQQSSPRIIDIAVKYGWTSADGFSRAFSAAFGVLPSEFKSKHGDGHTNASFPRMNIMDTLFEIGDKTLLEKYPDIKVLKKLAPMKVACFTYFGPDPEGHAFDAIKTWMNENGFHFNSKNDDGENAYRIFGYNNPDPSSPEETYGYEVCVTISDKLYDTLEDAPAHGLKQTYAKVMRRTLTGGTYMTVQTNLQHLGETWGAMEMWRKETKTKVGNWQWVEEWFLNGWDFPERSVKVCYPIHN